MIAELSGVKVFVCPLLPENTMFVSPDVLETLPVFAPLKSKLPEYVTKPWKFKHDSFQDSGVLRDGKIRAIRKTDLETGKVYTWEEKFTFQDGWRKVEE